MNDFVPTRRHIDQIMSTVEFDRTPRNSVCRADRSFGDWTVRASYSENIAALWPGKLEERNGFLNFQMNDEQLRHARDEALRQNARYGASDALKNQRILVEFVSADPTGPLPFSLAHAAASGDALCRLLEFAGADVTREFYLNDVETSPKMQLLGESVAALYGAHFGQSDGFEGALDDSFVRGVAQSLASQGNTWLLAAHRDRIAHFADAARAAAVESQKKTLAKFGVRFDVWTSESTLRAEGRVEGAMRRLQPDIFEKDGATWLRTSKFGDDADRVLVRRDGSPTYFASDIAYHAFKLERGFGCVLDIWTAEHRPYIERTRAAIRALGGDAEKLEFLPCEAARWRRDGKTFVRGQGGGEWTLDESLAELDAETVKYLLVRAPWNDVATLDFDVARRDDETNPAYAVRLLPSRLATRIGEAPESSGENANQWSENERAIARLVALWPDTAENAAIERAPWRVAAWLEEMARAVRDDLKAARPDGEKTSIQTLRAAHIAATNALNSLGIAANDNF